jgi:diguanylate cyclase
MPSGQSDEQLARRSRRASVALVVVLLAVSVFAIWSSQVTSNAARNAVRGERLADDYERATASVALEESLERKYRLEPGPAIRASYNDAAASFVSALGAVRTDGAASDRTLVTAVLAQHSSYLEASGQMFAQVDLGNTAAVLKMDSAEVDPSLGAIEAVVSAAAHTKHDVARAELAHLLSLERLTRLVTPLVFVCGLLLAAVLASITRGNRRLLDVERAQAVRDSLHDSLTGLPNRTLLGERFERALRTAERSGTGMGLLLIDLDRFKEINDTFGHHYGDELLKQIGPRLTEALRDVDTVARLGGDEFAVLLPDTSTVEDASAVATKLRSALSAPFRVEGVEFDVEASIGIVLSGRHGEDPTTLFQRADIAMYVAKTQDLGVFAYDRAFDGHSPAKLSLLGDLRRAIDRDELVLHYQPKASIKTGDLVGVEALVRWQHPERGLVFPDEFIPLAEHTGLIGPLTYHILNTALAQARVWMDASWPLPVAVNLSARNLLDEDLPTQVAGLLELHGVPADLLELEVTETAIMTEPVRAHRLLSQLSVLGVRVAVDDFGVGYTSLGQLKTLPVSELKIDRSFVMTMTDDRSNAVIVHSVIDLGHNLGLTIVAEGVENERTLQALAAVGCDVAQGYHLSRPVTPEAFDLWCAGRRISPLPDTSTIS